MLEYPNLLLMLLNVILFKCFTDWHVVYRNCKIKTHLSQLASLTIDLEVFPPIFFFSLSLYFVIHQSSLF
jgi:hypothetical protein